MISINLRVFKYPVILLLIVGVIMGVRLGYNEARFRIVDARLQSKLKRGLIVLAGDIVTSNFELFAMKPSGCATGLSLLAQSGSPVDVRRMSEHCIENGIDIEEIPLAFAYINKVNGRPEEALNILEQAQKKFPKSGQLILAKAEVLLETKQKDRALAVVKGSQELLTSQPALLMRLFKLYFDLGALTEAKALTPKFEAMGTSLPPDFKAILDKVGGMMAQSSGDKSEATKSPGTQGSSAPRQPSNFTN